MTDVNQVRINELARELEGKAKAIIDLLPGDGVTEKKNDSNSISEDVPGKRRTQARFPKTSRRKCARRFRAWPKKKRTPKPLPKRKKKRKTLRRRPRG